MPFDPRDVEAADVWRGEQCVARITRVPSGVRLTYLRSGATPVASSLADTTRTYATSAGALPAFFTNLLPEGRRLHALAADVATSLDDELSLLLAVGGDLVGDVTVVPRDTEPALVPPEVVLDAEHVPSVEELRRRALGLGRHPPDRVGLAGVQEKVSAARVALRAGAVAADSILKLPSERHAHLPENEALGLRAAREAGLRAAESEVVHDASGASALLVRRFDRRAAPGGRLQRFAQEDGCQALDRYPADRYRLDTAAVLRRLADLCSAPPVAVRDLFRRVAFGYALGDGDLHAKNLSVGLDPDTGLVRPTPAYDTVCTLLYDDHTLALPVDERREGVGRHRWLELARVCGLRIGPAERVLDDVADSTDAWLDRLQDLGFDERRTRKAKRALDRRRRDLAGLPSHRSPPVSTRRSRTVRRDNVERQGAADGAGSSAATSMRPCSAASGLIRAPGRAISCEA